MPWHLSKSDPRKVYDERHNGVCVCQTAEQAALIRDAVNAHRHDSRQIPDAPATSTSIAPEPIPHGLLDTYEPDRCCGRILAKALASGSLSNETVWECPVCCTTWKATQAGPVRHWGPVPMIVVF